MRRCKFCNGELAEIEGDKGRVWICTNQMCLNEKEYKENELPEHKWNVWTLYETDIRLIAKRLGIMNFSDDQIDDIARNFTKGFEWTNDNWDEIMKEAIREVIPEPDNEQRRGQNPSNNKQNCPKS